MTDPILFLLKSDLEIPTSTDEDEIMLVLNPLMKGEKGDTGERGDPPFTQEITTSGTLTIDYSLGRSVDLTLNGTVTTFDVINWPQVPNGVESALVLNITNNGNHIIADWPTGSLAQGGISPLIGIGAGVRSCVVLRTMDRGTTIFVDVVANNYQPIM